jgi:NAD(P) transhydrogenase subunit alpha
VDRAAERGGNCEVTRAGEVVEEQDVAVLGSINLASTVPYHASQLYARNVTAFLLHLFRDGTLHTDADDEITRETLVTQAGAIVNPRLREFFALPSP